MLLIALGLALLAIVGGMFLLARTQKENLGILFRYVSYFVIIMGFLSILGIGVKGIMRRIHARDRNQMMMSQQFRMNRYGGGNHIMNGMGRWNRMNGCCEDMTGACCGDGGCCDNRMTGCCDGGMMGGNCSDMMGPCCGDMMKGGKKDMMGGCNGSMGMGKTCPMDSAMKK